MNKRIRPTYNDPLVGTTITQAATGKLDIKVRRDRIIGFAKHCKAELRDPSLVHTTESGDQYPVVKPIDGAYAVRIGKHPKFIDDGPKKIWFGTGSKTETGVIEYIDKVIAMINAGELDDRVNWYFDRNARAGD